MAAPKKGTGVIFGLLRIRGRIVPGNEKTPVPFFGAMRNGARSDAIAMGTLGMGWPWCRILLPRRLPRPIC